MLLRRLAYRTCYLTAIGSGTVAAQLAADFRALGEANQRFGLLPVVLQLPVVLCWLVARPISLLAFAGCCALAPGLGR